MTTLRFKMIEEAIGRKAVEVKAPAERPAEYFGKYVFDRDKMRKYLPKACFETLMNTMKNGSPLDRETADCVAAGMKQWAQDMGATHYTHWFQPLTGGTAEKHDAFIEADHEGGVLEEFTGKLLIQQEPDASSFPSGGLRNTFEARGYSAWDPSSPAFIVDTTLCIPTIFIAYTGEALDFKAPLLRALEAVNRAAVDICRYFDPKVEKVFSYLGWEQEYFLVDESLWAARPDLVLTGRTMMGHESAKNQQLDDHYFGSIPTRVIAFMKDLEYECQQLGIPVKTRHNEVAPNQFELAPVFEETNLANDHNQLLMSTMKVVARRHCFRVLLHEKPFKGINGSGKHNNWSLGTDTGVNLLSPGRSATENLQFITFLVNILMAVYRRNGLLKASVMSAGNAHRLGANEAPPAILSVFLGTQLSAILDKIEFSQSDEAIQLDKKTGFRMDGITHIPELFRDTTDRNRTSPFAFTGNKFEFRMVGSQDSIAQPNVVLNTIVAEAFAEVCDVLEKADDFDMAVHDLIKEYATEHQRIVFNGNGYSDEWVAEAERRGLPNIRSMVDAIPALNTEKSVKLFEKFKVFTKAELDSRVEIEYETYSKEINIEARAAIDIATKQIIPAVIKYTTVLAESITSVKAACGADVSAQTEILTQVSSLLADSKKALAKLQEVTEKAAEMEEGRDQAVYYRDEVKTAMDELRAPIDKLEMLVDKSMWPMPSYGDLLFEV